MKLRIRGDSVRLRLTRGELDRLSADQVVTDACHFGAARLDYRVVRDPDATEPVADFIDQTIQVRLPLAQVDHWIRTETAVSMEGSQALPDGAGHLRILVEKDFACLQPRTGEDESDMFPHPGGEHLSC
jgi:hypothetical protein